MNSLILKEPCVIAGLKRVNNLKLKTQQNGSIQIFVNNGAGRGYFNLDDSNGMILLEWLAKQYGVNLK